MEVKLYYPDNSPVVPPTVITGGSSGGGIFEYYVVFNSKANPIAFYNLNTNKLLLNFAYGGINNYSSLLTTTKFYLKVNNEVLLNGVSVDVPANSTVFNNITKIIDCNNDGSASNIVITAGQVEFGTESYTTFTYHTNSIRNGHIKVSSSWKNAFGWKKINSTWKRCILWKKINGTWKKGD